MRRNKTASQAWNWLLYDVPDNRLFILALEHLFPQDAILVMDFAAIPDLLARESKTIGLGFPQNATLVSEFKKTGCSRGSKLTIWVKERGLRLIFGSGDRYEKDIKLWLEHIHVMRNKTYLMTGYDLGTDDGFMVTQTISEDRIKQFCNRVSCKYKKVCEPL